MAPYGDLECAFQIKRGRAVICALYVAPVEREFALQHYTDRSFRKYKVQRVKLYLPHTYVIVHFVQVQPEWYQFSGAYAYISRKKLETPAGLVGPLPFFNVSSNGAICFNRGSCTFQMQDLAQQARNYLLDFLGGRFNEDIKPSYLPPQIAVPYNLWLSKRPLYKWEQRSKKGPKAILSLPWRTPMQLKETIDKILRFAL